MWSILSMFTQPATLLNPSIRPLLMIVSRTNLIGAPTTLLRPSQMFFMASTVFSKALLSAGRALSVMKFQTGSRTWFQTHFMPRISPSQALPIFLRWA